VLYHVHDMAANRTWQTQAQTKPQVDIRAEEQVWQDMSVN
jgi:hypothetical protein